MEGPTEPDKTLKDSTHAPEVIEDQDDEQDEEENEDMEEKEIVTTPKEPFERVWQGKMVLKAIEGGILSIESGKMTRKEKKLITKTVVALWDALAGRLCIDQHEIIENNALWMMDPAGWRWEDLPKNAKTLKTVTILKEQVMGEEKSSVANKVKEMEKDLKIIKSKLGATTPQETQAMEKELRKKEAEGKMKAAEIKKAKEVAKAEKKGNAINKEVETVTERVKNAETKEREGVAKRAEAARGLLDPTTTTEEKMTYAVAATKANEDTKEAEEVRKYGNSEREVIEGGSSQT